MNTIYLEHYETYLISAPIEDAFIMKVDGGGGHRNCFGVTLGGGVTGYVKPDNGTTLSTTAVLNEVAAWETAKLLGWSHLMAPTVRRDDIVSPVTNTATTSSLQVFWWNAYPAPLVASLSPLEVEQAATFDYLIAHSDRSDGSNFLGVRTGTAPSGAVHLKLIDNGFSLGFPGRAPASVFVDRIRGRKLRESTITAVTRLTGLAPLSRLPALLTGQAYASLITRAERLVQTSVIE
jgi:hypothetical protein